MATSRRASLADLAAAAPMEAPVPSAVAAPPRLLRVPPATVAPNPVNHRDPGDLADLESMRDHQLQACVVVTRGAFLAGYPEHEAALGAAAFVVVAGSRRRAAAELYGLATLDVVVSDHLAATRAGFFGASLTENIDRLAPTPLEEAAAVEQLVAEAGTAQAAAEMLRKSPGWVSQRRALLRLSPAMKELLRAGELTVRDARRLAALPGDEQEPAWRREQVEAQVPVPDTAPPPAPDDRGVGEPEGERPLKRLRLPSDVPLADVAVALRARFDDAELRELFAAVLG